MNRKSIFSNTKQLSLQNNKSNYKTCAEGYRFGFNGKERDDEVKGSGNSIHYELREYDSRLGRMTSIDPRQAEYPWQSSYAYFSNSPIWKIDYLGGGDDKRTASNPNNPDSKGGTQKFHQKKVETDRKNTPIKLPTSTRTPQVVEKKTEFGNSGEFSANIGVIAGGQTKIEGNGGALGVTTPILGFKDNDFFVAGNNLSTGQFEKTEVVGFSMGGVGTQQVEKSFSFNRETRGWDQTKLQVTKDFGVLSFSFTNTPNEQVNKVSLKLDGAIGFGLNAEFKIQWDLITETQKLK